MNRGIVRGLLNSYQINASSVKDLIECEDSIRPSSLVSLTLGNTTATQIKAVRQNEQQLVQEKSIRLGEPKHDN